MIETTLLWKVLLIAVTNIPLPKAMCLIPTDKE